MEWRGERFVPVSEQTKYKQRDIFLVHRLPPLRSCTDIFPHFSRTQLIQIRLCLSVIIEVAWDGGLWMSAVA